MDRHFIEESCDELESDWAQKKTRPAEEYVKDHPEFKEHSKCYKLLVAEARAAREKRETYQKYLKRLVAIVGPERYTRKMRDSLRKALDDLNFLVPRSSQTDGLEPKLPKRFTFISIIGKGGCGTVYLAKDNKLNRKVALKFNNPEPHASEDSWPRFKIEGEVLAKLNHPHIVKINSWNSFNGEPYLEMEYLERGSLAQQKIRSPVRDQDAAQLLAILATAMEHAHTNSVVHRDLKPANIMFTRKVDGNSGNTIYGFPKICDFGLAKLLNSVDDNCLTAPGKIMGTSPYMSPEQALGGGIDSATDIYSLGIILYELLTGTMPDESHIATMNDKLPGGPAFEQTLIEKGVLLRMRQICLRCLAFLPRDRPTAAILAADLESFLRENQTGEDNPRPAEGSGSVSPNAAKEERKHFMIYSDPFIREALTERPVNSQRGWRQRSLYLGQSGYNAWKRVAEEFYDPNGQRLQNLRTVASKCNVKTFVSFGPGDGVIDREIAEVLRNRNSGCISYIPVDINEHLLKCSMNYISSNLNGANVPFGLQTDFEERIPAFVKPHIDFIEAVERPILFGLIGNTLGNLDRFEQSFHADVKGLAKAGDTLLIEVALDDGPDLLSNRDNKALEAFYLNGAAHQIKGGAEEMRNSMVDAKEMPHSKVDGDPPKKSQVRSPGSTVSKSKSFEIYYDLRDPDTGETRKVTALRSVRYHWDEMRAWLSSDSVFEICEHTPRGQPGPGELGVVLLKKVHSRTPPVQTTA